MPSVLDQPTCSPADRPMWAISRVTVVLPLVPVTATVGTRGTGSDGPGPASTLRSAAPAASTRSASPGVPMEATSSATALPRASAACWRRHG